MQSPCIREASQACFHGCCLTPLGLPKYRASTSPCSTSRYEFAISTAASLNSISQFTNPESLPSLIESFFNFTKGYPQFPHNDQIDQIRVKEYSHLHLSNHVCLDYVGHGLFSYSQQQTYCPTPPLAASSSSSSPPPPPPSLLHSSATEPTSLFEISYKSVNLNSHILYGGQESELESGLRKRIMDFMNISQDDYSMVFTANQTSAFKLLADSYPFQANKNLLTVYDYENEAVELMIDNSKKRGARVMSAEFSWPNLRLRSGKLMGMVESKRKKKKQGLFVFPLQSRMTGARYPYLWMSTARENGWHVLLDACSLGPKDMETLGLSLFKPDFLICSFYKIFGGNPSGFGCLFVKKSSASVLKDSSFSTSIGIVSLLPSSNPSQFPEDSSIFDLERERKSGPISESHEIEEVNVKKKAQSFSDIVELETTFDSARLKNTQIECRGLDHADSLGLILISNRARCLINWVINALMSLQHPNSENGIPLIRIYGPKVRFDRAPAVAFNVFDWKGEKVDPALVQKLADRNNISLSCGFLNNIWFPDKYDEEKEWILGARKSEVKGEKFHSGISVVTAALGFLTNFEDVYRLWAFVSRFLDADFVEKERWRYVALNQKTIEV